MTQVVASARLTKSKALKQLKMILNHIDKADKRAYTLSQEMGISSFDELSVLKGNLEQLIKDVANK